ncbi:MAG: type II secretion system protein [Deltaproteobacteria bacterium]|nr:type II secretion system protein [Deltaproteobacteria bacterium]
MAFTQLAERFRAEPAGPPQGLSLERVSGSWRQSGFTVVELVVIVSIIGIMLLFVTLNFADRRNREKQYYQKVEFGYER